VNLSPHPCAALDAGSLRRLALYLLILLASWLGGAMIERLVGAVFD
jgi:hypothetical protein